MQSRERIQDQQAIENFGDDEGAVVDEVRALGNGCGGPWRVAASLEALRREINALAPARKKASDGTIGDVAHCNTNSDHNPHVRDGALGVVTALDITHDPKGGCDCEMLATELRASRDVRIKYIIWNRRICSSSTENGKAPWAWRPYTRFNPHTEHLHLSVKAAKAGYDDYSPWGVTLGLKL